MTGAPRRGAMLKLFWRLHRLWYGLTGGRLGAGLLGWDVLQLTTRGRKTGEPRSVMLNYLRDGDALVVIGSNAGDDRDPRWWENLKAHPAAEVRTGAKRFKVRAREAAGTQRQLLWEKLVTRDPNYAEYTQRTKRRIPVILLEPARP